MEQKTVKNIGQNKNLEKNKHLTSNAFTEDIKKDIQNRVKKGFRKDVLNSNEFFFEYAIEAFLNFKKFSASKEFYHNTKEKYCGKNNLTFKNGFLSTLDSSSKEHELFQLIARIIAHTEVCAYNKDTWNKYSDNRVIAKKLGLFETQWTQGLLKYKREDNNLTGTGVIQNLIKFIESPKYRLNMLSERHRKSFCEKILQKEYVSEKFVDEFVKYFQDVEISVANQGNRNIYICECLYDKNIKKKWLEVSKKKSTEFKNNKGTRLRDSRRYTNNQNTDKNIIFFGPPGTGKTYKLLKEIAEEFTHHEMVTFHPSYSYEDFVEGIRPILDRKNGGNLQYKLVEGIFKEICSKAKKDKKNAYAIFIDEINRGNIPAIFGELITLIEEDKREEVKITLPYSKSDFTVPDNVYIYGTMNTADRSVESLDIALRRRFVFEEFEPDISKINCSFEPGLIKEILKTINQRIEALKGKDYRIGHSYFMNNSVNNLDDLKSIFLKKIIPLLKEYFYEDWEKLGLVLGNKFVEKVNKGKVKFAKSYGDSHDDYEDKSLYKISNFKEWSLDTFKSIYEEK